MTITGASLRIDHVGIAVSDLGKAVADFSSRMGVDPESREEVPADGIVAVFFSLGAESVELLGSTRSDSAIGRFLERRGEGMHHVAYLVDDIESELRRWQAGGSQLIDSTPRMGSRGRLVAFIHPSSEHGVLTELCQLPPGAQ